MKLTIYRKLLLSYLAMAFLTVLASAYAIFSLQQLNEIAYRIINDDFAVVDQSKSLLDSLIAQESAEKRYLILQDPTIEEIFWSRSREFNRIFEELRKGRFAGLDPKIARLSLLHSEYDALFFQEVQLVQAKRNEEAQVLSEGQGRKAIDEMAMLVRAVQKKAEENIDARMKRIDVQSLRASRLTVVLSLVSLVLGVLVVLLVTYNISRPLRRLEQATTMIAEGKFDFDFHLDRNDEIGSLSYAFGIMAQRLKILEERNLDASPLTGLPGNLAIERELGNRLQAKRPVSLCHVDLDNFKPFVDHYGYAWGSEVIKEAALLLIAELKEAGKKGDFLGHIGGDDFVLISVPPRAEQICRRIVAGFDGRIRKYYTETDREQGFFIGKDRQGVWQKFPLISVTIAIVTDDGTRFQNPLAMAEVAAQLKEYAKTLPGNNCVTEKDVHKV
ncbi:MAG: diguanylate cyclase [Syntrophaceae bacterium]|nr:diguanylate cyclase [Pseudomonadota bacterium]MCG2739469.1 diguanylate cyclase [Syntrophaceae bacterium]